MELESFLVGNDGMAGISASIIANNNVMKSCQIIRYLAFAFISKLESNNNCNILLFIRRNNLTPRPA
jgi:hypothetical protein